MASELSSKVAGAAIWVLGARTIVRASGLISIVILARLLPPEDFGIVGLTVAFLAAFEAMSDMSLNSALVRHPDLQRKHYDTAFSMAIIRSSVLGLIALFCAEPFAEFYGDERLVWVCYALAIQQFILGFINPGISDFQREFRFHRDFAYTALRKLGGVVTCITLALTIWPDYRALAAGTLASAVTSVAASYVLSPFRPRPSFAAFKELFGFTKWMMATNLLMFFNRRADTLIIGKTLGMSALGIQAVAMELANLVATEFAMPLQRAFMPSFAKLQNDLAAVRHGFSEAYGAAMALAIPFAIGVAAVAEPMIRLAFGEPWMAAVAPLQILAFCGLARASAQFCWPLIVALGVPRRLVPLQIISLAFGAPAIWYASLSYGLVGAAWAMFAMAALYAVLVMRAALRLIEAQSILVMSALPRFLGAALAMVLAIMIARAGLPPVTSSASAAIALFASVGVGAFVYPVSLILIWRVPWQPEGSGGAFAWHRRAADG